jgi:hypothetical protein
MSDQHPGLQDAADALLQQALQEPGISQIIDVCNAMSQIRQDYQPATEELFLPKVTYGYSTNGINAE